MERSSLKIFIHLRPDVRNEIIQISKDLHEVTVDDPTEGKTHTYDFYRVFQQDTRQDEVFDTACRQLVDHVMDGFDSFYIAYGVSGAGKSFNIFGDSEDASNRGMIARAAELFLEEANRLQSSKDITIEVSFFEMYQDKVRDLGAAVRDAHALRGFSGQNLEVQEQLGNLVIGGLSKHNLWEMGELEAVVNAGMELRAAYEGKNGEYKTKAHTFFTITVSQKDKLADWSTMISKTVMFADLASSEKPSTRSQADWQDQLQLANGFNSLAKCFQGMHQEHVPYTEHKLTKIFMGAFKDNAATSLMIMLNPQTSLYSDSLNSLKYAYRARPIKASYKYFSGDAKSISQAEADTRIKQLQDERAELKERFRRIELIQEQQLKQVTEMLGIEDDVDSLLQAAPGSKEMNKVQTQREAVLKIEGALRRNRELEKKLEENKQVFERIRRIEFQNQEKHTRKVLELKDNIAKLKEELEILKQTAEHNKREQINIRMEELQQTLTNSHILLEQKFAIVQSLPEYVSGNPQLPTADTMKRIGREEVEKDFRLRFKDQEKNHKEQIENMKQQYQDIITEKQRVLDNLVRSFKEKRAEKKQEIAGLRREMVQLWDIMQKHNKIISNIEAGNYNQHLRPVFIPYEELPEPPTQETHPEQVLNRLIKSLEQRRQAQQTNVKTSNHPQRRMQQELKQMKEIAPVTLPPRAPEIANKAEDP